MIHFSLSIDDAKLVMKALNLWACCVGRVCNTSKKDGQMKHILHVIAVAQKAAIREQMQPTTPRIEEIHTKEGIELCPVIS